MPSASVWSLPIRLMRLDEGESQGRAHDIDDADMTAAFGVPGTARPGSALYAHGVNSTNES
ncbi:MAG: hypothetical protein ACJ8DI_06355, partial [Ktedonobacteraceae bacterium]